jgi:type IV pilus assembly protein PilX
MSVAIRKFNCLCFNTTYLKQKGFVLFVALIALVAMSLAAVALIRSVDSGVLVAGNLAFKQSATLAADTSIDVATKYIKANTAALNTSYGTNSAAIPGYYATITNSSDVKYLNLSNPANWVDGKSVPITSATSPGIGADNKDFSGNSIRFIVQRMCRSEAAADTSVNDCLFGAAGAGGNSKNIDGPPFDAPPSTNPTYRITSRVQGPKNTVSLIQVYVKLQ